MKPRLKLRIASLTSWTMIATIGIIILWFIAFIVSITFNLKVFTASATEFLFAIFGFATILVICAAILNISINISLIADTKLKQSGIDFTGPMFPGKFYLAGGLLIVALIAFLFIGDHLSKQTAENKVITEAKDIVERYEQPIADIFTYIQDTSSVGKIPEVLRFLSNQKPEFSSVSVLTMDRYKNEAVFLQITQRSIEETLKKPLFGNSFYQCSREECNYLAEVFKSGKMEPYLWMEDQTYRFYYPLERNGKKITLLFRKYERYGKLGSF